MPKQYKFYSYYLVAACVAVFLLQLAFAPASAAQRDWFTYLFAITPALVLSQPWTLVTAMFLHGDLTHLLFNMFALYMFGPYLEYKIGARRFLALYFATGIIGNIGYALLSPSAFIAGLGASGAIYGIMGALAILEPNLEVFLFFITPMPLWMVMFFWTLVSLWGTLSLAGGIGYSAHLAGVVAGGAYAYWLKKKNAKLLDSYGLDY
jgi:membrane associated rhomboid family serine protease